MRDVVLMAVMAGLLPFALFRPFAGLLIFSWLAYFRPQDLAWTIARDLPLSMITAVVTVLGILLGRLFGPPFSPDERLVNLDRRTGLLVLFFAAMAVSAVFAVDPGAAQVRLVEVGKVVIIALLTTGLCRSRERVRWLLAVIALSLGMMAFKHAFFAVRTGEMRILKGPGGMIGDNNDFGLALVMTLPLLFYLGKNEKQFVLKVGSLLLGLCCVATVFFTRSRGGFIALAVIVVAWMLKFRNRAYALVVGPVLLVVTVIVLPGDLIERGRSLLVGRPDTSATLRFVAWKKALGMAADEPMWGVGPDNFTLLWDRYPPEVGHEALVVHNTYLQLLAENGLVGLLLYLGLLGSTLAALHALRARDAVGWRPEYSHGLELAVIGFAVGALFLTRGHFDLFYQIVGLGAALRLAGEQRESVGELFCFWRGREAGPAARASGAG